MGPLLTWVEIFHEIFLVFNVEMCVTLSADLELRELTLNSEEYTGIYCLLFNSTVIMLNSGTDSLLNDMVMESRMTRMKIGKYG